MAILNNRSEIREDRILLLRPLTVQRRLCGRQRRRWVARTHADPTDHDQKQQRGADQQAQRQGGPLLPDINSWLG